MKMEEYGNFYKTATIITDWDVVLENGIYMGNNAFNAPVSGQDKWFIGYVLRHNDKYVVQRAFSFNSDKKWYERYRNRDGWSGWVENVLLTRGEKGDLEAHLLNLEKHITEAERTAWNTKADSSHLHDERYYTETETDSKLAAKAAVDDLAAHVASHNNPHGVTAAQIGAVPTTRTVNSKALSGNIALSAADVGAATSSHNHDTAYDTRGAAATVQSNLTSHTGNTSAHITVAERTAWNSYRPKQEIARYTRNGTWTVPAGMTEIDVYMLGGGGGGHYHGYTSSSSRETGVGGASGFGRNVLNVAVKPGQTFNVVIGAGGTKGKRGQKEGQRGTDGGSTLFGNYEAKGGGGGGTNMAIGGTPSATATLEGDTKNNGRYIYRGSGTAVKPVVGQGYQIKDIHRPDLDYGGAGGGPNDIYGGIGLNGRGGNLIEGQGNATGYGNGGAGGSSGDTEIVECAGDGSPGIVIIYG